MNGVREKGLKSVEYKLVYLNNLELLRTHQSLLSRTRTRINQFFHLPKIWYTCTLFYERRLNIDMHVKCHLTHITAIIDFSVLLLPSLLFY